MIRTVLKTSAIAAALAGATLMAAPAHAGVDNQGSASHDTVNFTVIGGYGVTCASFGMAGNAATNCSHNHIVNEGIHNYVGNDSDNS